MFSIVRAAVVLAVAALALTAVRTGATGAVATPVAPEVFRDGSDQTVFTIQLAPERPDSGQFSFWVHNRGQYRGTLKSLQLEDDHDSRADDGTDTGRTDKDASEMHLKIRLDQTVLATFRPITLELPKSSVNLHVKGVIHLTDHSADVSVDDGTTEYDLRTAQPDPAQASAAAKQSLALTAAQDWTSLYNLLPDEVQVSYTPGAFAQLMAGQTQQRIVSSRASGRGTVTTTATGQTFYSVPLQVQMRDATGVTTTYNTTLQMVLQHGAWKVVTTTTPVPVS